MYAIILTIVFWNGSEALVPLTVTGSKLDQCQTAASRIEMRHYGQYFQGRGGAKSYTLECRK